MGVPPTVAAVSLRLRIIDPHYYAMTSQLQRDFSARSVDDAMSDVFVSKLLPHDRYLHLEMRNTQNVSDPVFDAYWPLSALCQQLFGDDRIAPSWVATEMVEAIANDWSRSDGWQFGLDGLQVVGVIGVVSGSDCEHFLFAHPSQIGFVYMHCLLSASGSSTAIRQPSLPLPLTFRAGCTHLDRRQLLSLRVGDAIRLMALAPVMLLEETHLCNFRFDGDTLVIERNQDVGENVDDFAPHALSDMSREFVEWRHLSLRCDFVLPTRAYGLLELDAMREGSILPLDSNAVTMVEMRIGKQVVAIGELVQIGEAIGFEVKRLLVKPTASGAV